MRIISSQITLNNRKSPYLTEEDILKFKQGDEKSFERVYDLYFNQLYLTAKKYLKDEEWAQDVIQEVFIKIWQKKELFNEKLPIENFLFVVMKNQILNTLRGKKREVLRLHKLEMATQENLHSTESVFRVNLFLSTFKKGILKLPPQKKHIFELHSFSGYTNKEIAHKLGISENTVKTQITRANKFLKDYIKKST